MAIPTVPPAPTHAPASPPASEPEPASPPVSAPEPPTTPAPAPSPEPVSPLAQALARIARAPVTILESVETPHGAFVVFRFNTLDAHLGALDPEKREAAIASVTASTATCEAQREAELAATQDLWMRERIEGQKPCDVSAAEGLLPPPPRPSGKRDPWSYPASSLSSRCDALGVALVTAGGAIAAHRVMTHGTCLARVEPLERRDFAGVGHAQIVLLATHKEWRTMPWGWTAVTEERALTAFDLRSGALAEVLAFMLDVTEYLDPPNYSTCRYVIDRPGVLTRYCDAWNSLSGGIEVDRLRWDAKLGRFGAPRTISTKSDEIPARALPADRLRM